jgi:hypothetical protein
MSIKSARGRSLARKRRNKVACVLLAIMDQRNKRIIRKPNVRRDRSSVLEFIRSKDDTWFEKSYRMPRTLFYMIHDLIRPVLETRQPDMAIRSSGSPLVAEVLLAATLRYLAGGSYIDIVDLYLLPPTCAQKYIWKTIFAIDAVLDNLNLPSMACN